MTNLFVAYTLAFIIIFIFTWLLISRLSRLEKKLDQLKQRLKEKSRRKHSPPRRGGEGNCEIGQKPISNPKSEILNWTVERRSN